MYSIKYYIHFKFLEQLKNIDEWQCNITCEKFLLEYDDSSSNLSCNWNWDSICDADTSCDTSCDSSYDSSCDTSCDSNCDSSCNSSVTQVMTQIANQVATHVATQVASMWHIFNYAWNISIPNRYCCELLLSNEVIVEPTSYAITLQ